MFPIVALFVDDGKRYFREVFPGVHFLSWDKLPGRSPSQSSEFQVGFLLMVRSVYFWRFTFRYGATPAAPMEHAL